MYVFQKEVTRRENNSYLHKLITHLAFPTCVRHKQYNQNNMKPNIFVSLLSRQGQYFSMKGLRYVQNNGNQRIPFNILDM